MKRYILLLALCALPFAGVKAQEPEKVYLPEKGDIAIGIDVAPIFKYVGNLFNGSTDNTLDKLNGEPVGTDVDGLYIDSVSPDVSIMGKYMLTKDWALRANVGLMIRSNMINSYVADDAAVQANPYSEDKVVDKERQSNHGMSLMVGAEYHKGKRRVQGIFGFGLLAGFNQQKSVYTYGNAITSVNQNPTSSTTMIGGYRPLSTKSNSNFFIGVAGSVGIEWFVAPKIALGADVNLSLYYVFGGQQYTVSEGFNATLNRVEERTNITSPGNDTFRFGTDNLGGTLYVSFYF